MLCCVVCWMGIGAEERVMVRGSEKRMMADRIARIVLLLLKSK